MEWSTEDIQLDIDAPDGFNVGKSATMKMTFESDIENELTDLFM